MRAVLFDLDGTLTDSGEGIMNSVRYALRRFGIDRPEQDALRDCIGPPLLEAFARHWRLSPAECRRALAVYREYFRDRGIWENRVYPGIPELLEALRGAGTAAYIATSKPEEFAVRIAERFGLAPFLRGVVGNTLADDRPEKSQVISHIMSLEPGLAPGSVLMVGDRKHDAEGAAACGIRCVGAAYGYGSREELEAAGAWRVADTVEELRTLLLGDWETD